MHTCVISCVSFESIESILTFQASTYAEEPAANSFFPCKPTWSLFVEGEVPYYREGDARKREVAGGCLSAYERSAMGLLECRAKASNQHGMCKAKRRNETIRPSLSPAALAAYASEEHNPRGGYLGAPPRGPPNLQRRTLLYILRRSTRPSCFFCCCCYCRFCCCAAAAGSRTGGGRLSQSLPDA